MSTSRNMKPHTKRVPKFDTQISSATSLNIMPTSAKRKHATLDSDPEFVTQNNPFWAAAEKGDIGQHLHKSKTALRRVIGHDGILSKDMARIHFTVYARQSAIWEWKKRKMRQHGESKRNYENSMARLQRLLEAAECRENRQKSNEENTLEKMLKGITTPDIPGMKRRKSSVPTLATFIPKYNAPLPHGANEDQSETMKKATNSLIQAATAKKPDTYVNELCKSQDRADITVSFDTLNPSDSPQMKPDGVMLPDKPFKSSRTNVAGVQIKTVPKNILSENRDQGTRKESGVREYNDFSLANIRAKIQSNEERLMHENSEMPPDMSLSALFTKEGLPKQRSAGKGPFPIMTHGKKRHFEATNIGVQNTQELMRAKPKRPRVWTDTTEQTKPIMRRTAKSIGPTPNGVLRKESLQYTTSTPSSPNSVTLGQASSIRSRSRQRTVSVKPMRVESQDVESDELKTAGKARAADRGTEPKSNPDSSTDGAESPAHSDLSSQSRSTENEDPRPSFAKASDSPQQKTADVSERDSPVKLSSQTRPLAKADVDSSDSSWDSDEETCCEEDDDIPPLGTKLYDRYVDRKLEQWYAAKNGETKRDVPVPRMPSEDPKRLRSSETLHAYEAALLAFCQDQAKRHIVRKKGLATRKDFMFLRSRAIKMPELPPTTGHEIAAKGTWSNANQCFSVAAKPDGTIHTLWKVPEKRQSPPSHRDSGVYQNLKGREKYNEGPKPAPKPAYKTAPRSVASKPPSTASFHTTGPVYQKPNGYWRYKPY